MNFSNEKYEQHKRKAFYALMTAGAVVVGYYLLNRILFPFFMAWLTVLVLHPVVTKGVLFTKISRPTVTAIILILILLFIGVGVFFAVKRLYDELVGFLSYVDLNGDKLINSAGNSFGALLRHLGIKDTGELSEILSATVKSAMTSLSSKMTVGIGVFASRIPGFFFSGLIYIMATYYIAADYDGFERRMLSLLPMSAARRLGNVKGKFLKSAGKYVRAYLIILVITFVELFAAFLILRIKYAMLLAAVIALLDILPAIGVGTVLVPWAIWSAVTGNVKTGISLGIVFVIVSVIRQIIEPKIVGEKLGISPLLTLFSVFVGYKLLGVIGIIIAPIAVILVREFFILSKGGGDALSAENKNK